HGCVASWGVSCRPIRTAPARPGNRPPRGVRAVTAGRITGIIGRSPRGPPMPEHPTHSLAPGATADLPPPDRGSDPAAQTTAAGLVGSVTLPGWVGRYELREEIARGGMGAVFAARDAALARDVAVKVLQERFAADPTVAGRFLDEARITAQLQHPGIPPVHDVGTLPDGRPFLAMKLIKGETLDRRLAGRADPSAGRGRFLAVFEQICQAVAYAHSRGVIHRDLKPANVMVGAFAEVQVMDWGLAKVLTAGREHPRP